MDTRRIGSNPEAVELLGATIPALAEGDTPQHTSRNAPHCADCAERTLVAAPQGTQFHYCDSPRAPVSPVTGAANTLCSTLRRADDPQACGPRGWWFVAKPQPEAPRGAQVPLQHGAVFDLLLSELQAAHELMRIAMNCMGRREQELFAAASEAAQLGTDGASRHHERAAVIARASALRDLPDLAAKSSTCRTGDRP